jgi:dihydropteroate synthase
VAEELARVLPVVRGLASQGLVVSVDTRHVEVAQACVEAGASIVNDVSGFRDPRMVELAASCDAGLVAMHMQGEPGHMQDLPHYDDVVGEVEAYLVGQARVLEGAGVASGRICIDPGIGFGKTYAHNLALLQATPRLASLGWPLLVGLSRKRFIDEMRGSVAAHPHDRDLESALLGAWTCARGASVLRAHNVALTVRALQVLAQPKDA